MSVQFRPEKDSAWSLSEEQLVALVPVPCDDGGRSAHAAPTPPVLLVDSSKPPALRRIADDIDRHDAM